MKGILCISHVIVERSQGRKRHRPHDAKMMVNGICDITVVPHIVQTTVKETLHHERVEIETLRRGIIYTAYENLRGDQETFHIGEAGSLHSNHQQF